MAKIDEQALDEITRGIASHYPLFYIQSWEEERVERALAQLSETHYGDDRPIRAWTAAHGLNIKGKAVEGSKDPLVALEYIHNSKDEAIYLFKDLPALFENNNTLIRALRDLYYHNKHRDTYVFISYPLLNLPETLKKEMLLIDFNQPTETEIYDHIRESLIDHGKVQLMTDDWAFRAAYAMKGLSLEEIDHLLLRILDREDAELDEILDEVHLEKGQILKKESCLRFMPRVSNIDEIGGLENLKEWVTARKDLFTRDSFDSGIPLPSGILFMGVSGCGKSLASKVIASNWDLQLVRLDMNMVMSGMYGAPEYAFEQAVSLAETIAPVVLWIDELENSFGYDTGNHSGGNINIFSSFLTWMQEKPSSVFVTATANRIEMVPAEMIRKGRFDQVFFLDLPSEDERKEIFRIHITNNGQDPERFELDMLAKVTKEWSGAEIEQAVRSARIDAYGEHRDFVSADVFHSTSSIVPLSKTMEEQIRALRGWSFDRATPASKSRRR